MDDVKTYWNGLTDINSGYDLVDQLWSEIEPIYKKLQNFVKVRLENYYNTTFNDDTIPVYLLGSNFGDDWSVIAPIILPHPQIHYDAETYLKYRVIIFN